MTKKQLATLVVETEFNRKYKTVLDDFDNSGYKKLVKVRIKFLKLMKVLFILVGALSFFTLLFGVLDLAYSQDIPGKGALTAIIGSLSISIIVSCLYNFPIKIIKNVFDVNCDKKPIGKYCFKGFD